MLDVSTKRKRPRTARREDERASAKLADAREKLASLEPGGTPHRPVLVSSASVVEPHAGSMPCARCGGPLRVVEHSAREVDGARLRLVDARCATCGARRAIWFQLPVLN